MLIKLELLQKSRLIYHHATYYSTIYKYCISYHWVAPLDSKPVHLHACKGNIKVSET